jgi:putative DNA primase/helicase
MIDLRQIAAALGGEVCGQQVRAPGPNHSPRDRSLSVLLTADGFIIVNSFAGDNPLACKDYVRSRLGMPPWQPGDGQGRRVHPSRTKEYDHRAVEREAERRPRSEDDLLRIKRAVAIWDQGADPRGTLAERYLNEHRKLELCDELAGAVLRFHPRCPWRNEDAGTTDYVPALIAAFRSIDDNTITAIHRIALNNDGTKLARRMLGVVHRAAVKLDPNTTTGELAIGEGVETCMAARQLGIRPCWALGSVGAILFFPLIPAVVTLRIIGENDVASQPKIEMCGRRWRNAGRRVRVIRPTAGDKDLNDALMRNGYGRAS